MTLYKALLHWLTTAIIAVILLWIVVIQGDTITAQRKLIRDMSKNPNCMIP